MRELDETRSGNAKPRLRNQRDALGGAGQHRAAAEDIADADREHAHAHRAKVEQRAQRAGEGELRRIRLVEAHASGRAQQHDHRRPLDESDLEQPAQHVRMIGAGAAAEEALVLRGDERGCTRDRRARDDNPVVVLGRDAPSREMRRRPRRGKRRVDRGDAARIGDRRDAQRGREGARAVERRTRGGAAHVNDFPNAWCATPRFVTAPWPFMIPAAPPPIPAARACADSTECARGVPARVHGQRSAPIPAAAWHRDGQRTPTKTRDARPAARAPCCKDPQFAVPCRSLAGTGCTPRDCAWCRESTLVSAWRSDMANPIAAARGTPFSLESSGRALRAARPCAAHRPARSRLPRSRRSR